MGIVRRFLLLSLVAVLVASLAAPYGAVFASEPLYDDTAEEEIVREQNVSEESAMGVENEPTPIVAPSSPVQHQVTTPVPSQYDTTTPAATTDPVALNKKAIIQPPKPGLFDGDTPIDDSDRRTTSELLIQALRISYNETTIELKNTTDRPVHLRDWTLTIVSFVDGQHDDECGIEPSGYLLGSRSITFTSSEEISDAYTISGCDMPAEDAVVRIELRRKNVLEERVKVVDTRRYIRNNVTDTYRSGIFLKDFTIYNPTKKHPDYSTSMLYEPPDKSPLQIIELHGNPNLCAPVTKPAIECFDYVKIYNASDDVVDLSKYRLRVGQIHSPEKTSHTFQLYGTIEKNNIAIVQATIEGGMLSLPNESSTAWLQDAHGLVDYPSNVPPYSGGNTVANKGRSWALDQTTNTWRWATPAPNRIDNDFTPRPSLERQATSVTKTLKPCRPDQYRSKETNRCRTSIRAAALKSCLPHQYRHPETNRCRSLASHTANVKPCRPDQVRNPVTNRCKKIGTMTTALKPCRPGQIRHPDTNRCRGVASAQKLKPCKPGQIRHPETNRCRKVLATTPPSTHFAVEDITEPTSVFVGWWVLGGIALVVIGYIGWEWREEVKRLIRRVFHPVKTSR